MKRLWQDESGVILPYVTVLLVIFIGVSALALDAGRASSLQTQLQKAADAAAIAGAAELDRLTDSTTRATDAINNLLTNGTLFGTGANVNATISSIRFLAALPASDVTPITNVLCTTACTNAQSIQARFVEVTVTPVTIPTIFPVSFFGAAQNNVTAGATAVAGNDSVACGITPMFICNPFEQPGDSYAQATQRIEQADADASFRSKLIRLADSTAPGASGTFGPGDFGYLVPEPGTLPNDSCFPSGQEIAKAMAMNRPLVCVRQNGVDLLTGNTTNAINGLNTRFGKYTNSFSSTCRASYPPDVNVRTGWKPQNGSNDWCRGDALGTTTGASIDWPPGSAPYQSALPADSCLLGQNNCTPIANIGASTWDCATYWAAAHGAGSSMPGCTSAATISRYSVYQYEIANSLLNDVSQAPAGQPGETGTPQCLGPTPTTDRRILNVAIVNCGSSPVTVQSNAQNVPVAAFGRFFLTVAVPSSGQVKPYAEFLGILKRGEGTVYDQVQLYR